MIKYEIHHVNGLYFKLLDDEGKNKEYKVEFIDNADGKIIYETNLKPEGWAKLSRKYLSDIVVRIRYKDRVVTEVPFLKQLSGKRVFISFESKSLGDTIAWMPYCKVFKEKWNCDVTVSTFHNYLFEDAYPMLNFVGRGVTVNNLIAMFEIGWFYDPEKEPTKPNLIPLQKAATNILMLDYEEVLPDMAFVPQIRPTSSKYVCISTQSTSALKHWDYWQDVINYLKSKDYVVYEMSKDPSKFDGLDEVSDKGLPNTMNYLYHSEFVIGLSSGISWLAWGLRKKVIMISNFSQSDHEFQTNCIRIIDKTICHGCWNNELFKFNKADWNWCPEHEDTPRQFECHKKIPPQKVIEAIVSITG